MLSVINLMESQISAYAPLVALLFCLSAIVYYCLAIYAAIDFRSQPITADPDFHPPVSILKPLCGLDHHTYENLASFCVQDYPTYQIVFGIQDSHDPVIAIVKQIMDDFPAADISMVVSDHAIGTNLKISNLANAATKAKHGILLISDGDIRVEPHYLRSVVQPLANPAVGVVTCMYRSFVQSWIAALEALGISTELAPTVLVSRKLEGMTFGIGATIAIRRSVLDAIGGFLSIANYLHDDFHLGRMPTLAGYQVVLSHYVVNHALSTHRLSDLIQHQGRWNRGIRVSQPLGYAGQIFTFGTIAGGLFLLAMHGAIVGWIVLGITWLFRLAMAWTIGIIVLRDPIVRQLLWLVPLSDVLRFLLWCYGFVGNSIEWRGRQLRLSKGGKLIALS